jgi:predicted cupin superfamily sugar epimerase
MWSACVWRGETKMATEISDARAGSLVHELQLAPHPEGGFYRQLYRSESAVQPTDGRPVRASLTTIYFLLRAGQHSRWHRVRSDEVWHFYEGDPLELLVADPGVGGARPVTLGPIGRGEPVHVVPANWWQAARPLGRYALVGCTVAPGFVFEDFSLLRDEADGVAVLRAIAPDLCGLL